MGVFVNGILTTSAQNLCYGNSSAGALMIWRFFEDMWSDAGAALRKQARRELDVAAERQDRERADERKKQDDRDAADLVMLLLASDELQQALRKLSNDINVAIAAARRAYHRAEAEQGLASRGLKEAQEAAIVLGDGRRVYFTANGQQLFGEDRQEITDLGAIDEARSASREKQHATTFEEYAEWEDRFVAANLRVQQIAEALDRLHDLNAKLESGGLTAGDLQRLRHEQQSIVDDLPADARADYKNMREGRERSPAYHALDAEAERALTLTERFSRADQSASGTTEEGAVPNRPPVYKPVPEF
jgi:hypothetical protein